MSTNQSNAKYLNIRDIAKLAGVSTATVSRVLNHPELTSSEIRARVQAIVQEHHYVPNQMVKSLFSHSADSIAVFVYDMANPFFIALIQELNRVAFDHKHALLICDTSNDIQKESDYLDYCAAIRVKGIILTEGFEFNPASNQLHSPLVMFDRVGQNVWPSVQSDNTAAIARASSTCTTSITAASPVSPRIRASPPFNAGARAIAAPWRSPGCSARSICTTAPRRSAPRRASTRSITFSPCPSRPPPSFAAMI